MPNIKSTQWVADSHLWLCCVGLFWMFHQRGIQKTNAELINNISSIGDLSKYLIACLSEDNLKKINNSTPDSDSIYLVHSRILHIIQLKWIQTKTKM
jgi:hypothetical protein